MPFREGRQVAREAGEAFAAKWQSHADQRILGKVKLAVIPASNAAATTAQAFCKAHGRSFQAALRRRGVWSPTRKGDGGRVDLNLNRDLADNYVKQIRPLLMNFIAKEEKFIRKQTKELKQKMEDELRSMEGFAGGVIQKTVRDLADAAVRSANLAITAATDEAFKNAQEGQKHVLWGLESRIREEMNNAYTKALILKGKGASALQKKMINEYIATPINAKRLYEAGAKQISDDLCKTIEGGCHLVQEALQSAATQIEDTFADLGGEDGPDGSQSKLYQMAHGRVQVQRILLDRSLENVHVQFR